VEYRTKSGRVLTDAEIQKLADEAERGYDVEHLRDRPRETVERVRERLRRLTGRKPPQ